jgi:hypothetical protein
VSQNYLKNKWAKYELKAALVREFEEDWDQLQLKLDETEIDEILPTKAYLNWFQEKFEDIVDMVVLN